MAQLMTTGPRHNSSSLSLHHASAHHALLNASLKIAGVVILLSICALVLLTQRASGGNKTAATSVKAAASIDAPAKDEPVTSPGSSSSVSSQTSVSAQSSTNSTQPSVQVKVNGQDVPVPENGSVHHTVTNPDGSSTSYSVNATQGTGSNSSSTSTSVNVSTNSSSVSSQSSTNLTIGGDSQ